MAYYNKAGSELSDREIGLHVDDMLEQPETRDQVESKPERPLGELMGMAMEYVEFCNKEGLRNWREPMVPVSQRS